MVIIFIKHIEGSLNATQMLEDSMIAKSFLDQFRGCQKGSAFVIRDCSEKLNGYWRHLERTMLGRWKLQILHCDKNV